MTSLDEEESSTNVFASLTTLLKDLGSVKEPLAGFVSVLAAPFARFRILYIYGYIYIYIYCGQTCIPSNSMPDRCLGIAYTMYIYIIFAIDY